MTRSRLSADSTRTVRWAIAVAIACAIAILATTRPATGAEDRPLLLGMATHWDHVEQDIEDLTDAAGKPPAFYQAFFSLDLGYEDVLFTNLLDRYEALGMAPYLEVFTDDYDQFLAGQKDAELNQIVRVVGDWVRGTDRRVLIAPFPEPNIPDHAWGWDPSGYQYSYLRVYDAFRDAGIGPDNVRFVFSMNGPGSYDYPYPDFYPGDEYVDIVGFSAVNRGTGGWRDYDATFGDYITRMKETLTRIKPILVTQTGSIEGTGNQRDVWLDDMFTGLAGDSQVIGAIYFNRDQAGYDLRVVADGFVEPAFSDGYLTWSSNTAVDWIFDGRMDAWVQQRADEIVFDDITSSVFADDILWVAEQGITLGCDDYRYCPDDPVTRAQMASFLARALGLPASATDWFTDDDGSNHESNINAVADASITLGCGAGQYCGSDLVTRAQMASFLARALDLPASPTDWFVDDETSSHEPNINSVADAAITLGCGTGVYCPGDVVTRGQMAAFLHRALTG